MARKRQRLQMQKSDPDLINTLLDALTSSAQGNEFNRRQLAAIDRAKEHQIASAVEKQLASNNAYLQDYTHKYDDFHAALTDVKVTLGRIETLFFANGGKDTQQAMGRLSDELMAVLNRFSRQVETTRESPFTTLQGVEDFREYCKAIREAAYTYATIGEKERAACQRKFAEALAAVEPILAELQHPPRENEADNMLAQMLIDGRERTGSYAGALDEIRTNYPSSIYAKRFTHTSRDGREEYARKIVQRYRDRHEKTCDENFRHGTGNRSMLQSD